MCTVREKLKNGYYNNTESYPKMSAFNICSKCNKKLGEHDLFCSRCGNKHDEKTPKERFEEQRKKYNENESKIMQIFKEESLEEVGLKGHETENRAWDKALNDGRDKASILSELEELSKVILG